jgi:type I restriction enzyme S subunit
MPRLRTEDAVSAPFPLPPLSEQHRIVAKANELMALCDQLEAAQKERHERVDGLRAASLHRLTASNDDRATSAAAVRFFLHQSSRSITKPEHVAAVRQAILDLAVAGRLTRRPAVSLAWSDETLASVCDLIVDGDHNPPARQPSGIPHLTAKHITGGRIDLTGCTFISEEDFALRRKRYSPRLGDLILTCVGTLGRTAIVPDGLVFSADRNLAALRPNPSRCISAFLKLVIDSPSVQARLTTASGQTAQPHIYLKDIREQRFTLPPLVEQDCIVARVDELMAVCTALETALASAQDLAGHLRDALFHQAVRGRTLQGVIREAAAQA